MKVSYAKIKDLLQRFGRDESGGYVIIVALLMPVLIGTAGLGTEGAWWLYKHREMQSAADSGAVSAATAGTNVATEANSITASYGYANGTNSVTVGQSATFERQLYLDATGGRSGCYSQQPRKKVNRECPGIAQRVLFDPKTKIILANYDPAPAATSESVRDGYLNRTFALARASERADRIQG